MKETFMQDAEIIPWSSADPKQMVSGLIQAVLYR